MLKEDRIFDYLRSRQLPTGRRIFVLKAVQKVAADYGLNDLEEQCDKAIADDEKTLELERRYKRQQKQPASRGRGDAAGVDRVIDGLLGAMHAIADGQAFGDDETAKKARHFLAEVFPVGLGGLVRLPFEEQLAVEENLLKRFAGDLEETVRLLGLERHVAHLKELVPEFRAELERSPDKVVTYEDIRKARAAGLDRFAAVVFRVLAENGGSSRAQREQRQTLLAEYHRQNDIIARANRNSRGVVDIDPETGEEMNEEEVLLEEVADPVE